jgi:hypothetical protein
MTKTCSRCKEPKTLNEFYRSKGSLLGVHSYCKHCMKMYAIDRQEIRARSK